MLATRVYSSKMKAQAWIGAEGGRPFGLGGRLTHRLSIGLA